MTWTWRVAYVLAATLMFALPMHKADAVQIEPADTTVERVEVTYAEPVPTKRFGNRYYFETNDGAAYRYVTYGTCARADLVPNHVCRTVFWYAR